MAVPSSVLTKDQKKVFRKEFTNENNEKCSIVVTIRYDDQCGNGHNTFSITGHIREGVHSSSGCIHEAIAKYFPEFAPLIKWHLCSSDGPLHYLANTLYHVDQHGPTYAFIYYSGKHDPLGINESAWVDKCYNMLSQHEEELLGYKTADIARKCEGVEGYRVEWDQKSEKFRDLDAARHSAVWPEATDEELTSPDLKQRLIDRLPTLIEEFKEMVESLGFTY